MARPAICPFCKGSMKIDYKDASMLARYISSQGKIVSRRRSRTCAKHQRSLSQAIEPYLEDRRRRPISVDSLRNVKTYLSTENTPPKA